MPVLGLAFLVKLQLPVLPRRKRRKGTVIGEALAASSVVAIRATATKQSEWLATADRTKHGLTVAHQFRRLSNQRELKREDAAGDPQPPG